MKPQPPFVRNPYNYDIEAACEECCVKDFGPSLTQQSQAKDADINEIVRRFGITGQMPANLKLPLDTDFEDIFDYKSAMDAVAEARSTFMKIPPHIRQEFANDPQEFVEFCSNKENIPKLREWGLANPEAPQTASPPTGPGMAGTPPNPPPAPPGGS
jgi:hypothetical protein